MGKDTRSEEQKIKDKILGSIGETVFEKIHLELKCEIYRTGHEFLYPHLLPLANVRRQLQHKLRRDEDFQTFKKIFSELSRISKDEDYFKKNWSDEKLLKVIGEARFKKSETGNFLATSPDFIIVPPSGCIYQFEVKFYKNGLLKDSDSKKYLSRGLPPNIFILMPNEPFLNIYYPFKSLYIDGEKCSMEIMKKYGYEGLKNIKDSQKEFKWEYDIKKRNANGDLEFDSEIFESDKLIYSKKIIEKYGKIMEQFEFLFA